MIPISSGWPQLRVAGTDIGAIDTGLSTEAAVKRANELLKPLPVRAGPSFDSEFDDSAIDILHAACRIVAHQVLDKPAEALLHARALYSRISEAEWIEPDFEERAELLCDLALTGWRAARRSESLFDIPEWLERFNDSTKTLHGPISEPVVLAELFDLENSESLLALYARLFKQLYSSPSRSRDEAEFIYHFLEESPRDIGLFNERDYFLGEFALVAGTASSIGPPRRSEGLVRSR